MVPGTLYYDVWRKDIKNSNIYIICEKKVHSESILEAYGNKPTQHEKNKVTSRQCGERIQLASKKFKELVQIQTD